MVLLFFKLLFWIFYMNDHLWRNIVLFPSQFWLVIFFMCVLFKKTFSYSRVKKIVLPFCVSPFFVFAFLNSRSSFFTFRSMIHFQSIFTYGVRIEWKYFFPYRCTIDLATLFKDHFPSLNCDGFFDIHQVWPCIYVCGLPFVPVIC